MGIEEKIYKISHGHYGGYYVSVPEENFNTFKKSFPKQTFPRKHEARDVSKDYTPQGASHFNKAFPKSSGKLRKVYFGDRTKGSAHLEKMIDFPNAQKKDKWY
jgi:hypothetical protein